MFSYITVTHLLKANVRYENSSKRIIEISTGIIMSSPLPRDTHIFLFSFYYSIPQFLSLILPSLPTIRSLLCL